MSPPSTLPPCSFHSFGTMSYLAYLLERVEADGRNTKTGLYLDAIHSSEIFNKIIDSTPKPNAMTKLEEVDRDETCLLGVAGDVVMMLIDGLLDIEGVEKCIGEVESAELEVCLSLLISTRNLRMEGRDLRQNDQWTITTNSRKVTAPQLHLSTGSHPSRLDLHTPYPNISVLDLDQVMILSSLPSLLPANKKSVVGIIGNSHSGILAAMNLWTIASSSSSSHIFGNEKKKKEEGEKEEKKEKRDLKIINFQRREILFAEYRDDGIVWDNSGLKGRTAEWAREHMSNTSKEGESESKDGIIKQIRFDLSPDSEDELYKRYLPQLTHLIYAVGYVRNPLPPISINSNKVKDEELEFDMHSSGFHYNNQRAKGLYGTGIAFPEETEDPEGHVEAAVGFGKFVKFAERVKGEWGRVTA